MTLRHQLCVSRTMVLDRARWCQHPEHLRPFSSTPEYGCARHCWARPLAGRRLGVSEYLEHHWQGQLQRMALDQDRMNH